MESGVVIKTVIHVIKEVFHRHRGFLIVQLQFDITGGGGEQNMRVAFCGQRSRRESRKGEQSRHSRQSRFNHKVSLTKCSNESEWLDSKEQSASRPAFYLILRIW